MAKFLDRLYCGHIDPLDELPKEQSHQIKVFLSCNSTDFCEERDAIFSRVVPQIREEAKAKYGLEFHYLDLKWGVDLQEENDFKTREFMLKQLLKCQQQSVGPNFLVLLGQKYGHRPAPHLILSEKFDLMRTALDGAKGKRARNAYLLDVWYRRDENSIPAIHVLQKPNAQDSEERIKAWKEQQQQLRQVLMYGAELCCKEGSLPLEALRTYFASEFENEVRHGLMGSTEESSLAINREIRDLPNYVSEIRATAFTEVTWNSISEKWEMVKENQDLLQSLKKDVVRGNLPESNVFDYSILWRYDAGVDAGLHKDYINQLCQDIKERLCEQIADAAAIYNAHHVVRSSLESEVLLHWRTVLSKGVECLGREDELNRTTGCLRNSNDDELLVIYGDSGSGTTCFMSKLLLEMKTIFPAEKLILVVRFLGLTPESQNLKNVLKSICQQLLYCLKRSDKLPIDFTELQKFFIHLLNNIPRQQTLVILLDSVSNLLPDFGAHSLKWLPQSLPSNVKVVISCQSHTHGMITKMKTQLIQNQENFIELLPLSHSKAMSLMLRWLQQESMAITNDQAEILKQIFTKSTLPLYLQLIFCEIRQWTSFEWADIESLGTSCSSYLDIFFTKLEQQHGEVVVIHALAYLTASKTGVSDAEMEDLLSLDDAVLSFIHQHSSPVVYRCPPYIWSRLQNDLERFLESKVSDNHDVQYWNHPFLTKYVETRYLSDETFVRSIHHSIADYYLGTWHGKQMLHTDGFGRSHKADRKVISQPLTYQNAAGEVEYNRRKYDQVPRHLFLADRLKELNDRVLFNYEWIYNKIKVLSLQHILADLSLNPSVEATLLEESLRSAQVVLENNINNMPAELSGRLLPYYHTHPNIRKLIQQCDTAGLSHCALVPIFNYQQIPGSPLQHTLNYKEQINCMQLLSDGVTLAVKSHRSQIVRLFDISTGLVKADISTSYGRMMVSPDDKYLVIVDSEIKKAIKIHSIHDGRYRGQLIPLKATEIKSSAGKYALGAISISEKFIAILFNTGTSYLCLGDIETVQLNHVIRLDAKSHLVHIASNSKYVLCGVGYNVVAYDLENGDQICLTQLEYKATSLVMTKTCTKVFYFNEESHVITTCHNTAEGYTQMLSKIHMARQFSGDQIKRLTLSRDQNSLMALGNKNIVVFNTISDKLSIHIRKPADVMKEFQLPKNAEPTPIVYTDALFSLDDNFLLVSLFRNIQIWDIKMATPLPSSIIAPVGIISALILSPLSSQIVSLQHQASCVQVWNLTDSATDIASLDRLNAPIESIVITPDNTCCFTRGKGCGEVAVIDLATGTLSNFLTHHSVVEEIIPVSDGSFLLTTVKPQGDELHHKIWSLKERTIIHQFGETRGLSVALRKSNKLIHINRSSSLYMAPSKINIYTFEEDGFSTIAYDFLINHAISQPVVTADDTYMVLLTADEYIESKATYSNPAICTLYLHGRYMHNVIGKNELGSFLDTRYMTSLIRIPESRTKIIVIYQQFTEGDLTAHSCYGYVSINLATGTPLQYNDNFMSSSTDLRTLYLNNSGSHCINSHTGNILNMAKGSSEGKICNNKSPIALLYDGATVVYFSGSYLTAEQVSDNKILARCDVHVDISYICAGNDGKTVMVGCVDGTVLSYAVVISEQVDSRAVVGTIPTRTLEITKSEVRPMTAPTWDTVQVDRRAIQSARMSTEKINCVSDREILRKIRPVYRNTSAIKPMTSYSLPISASYNRSKTCSMM